MVVELLFVVYRGWCFFRLGVGFLYGFGEIGVRFSFELVLLFFSWVGIEFFGVLFFLFFKWVSDFMIGRVSMRWWEMMF